VSGTVRSTVSTLKMYTDAAYKPDALPHAPILYPFWGAPTGDARSPTGGRYDRFVEEGRSFLELVPLELADVAVLPVAWEHVEGDPEAEALALALAFAAAATDAGVPVVVFYIADSTERVPLDGAVVFRTSLMRSQRAPNERAMPALSVDLRQELGGSSAERTWRERPVVGFCGYAPGAEQLRRPRAIARAVRRRVRVARGELAEGIYARARALHALGSSRRIQLNAIVRDAFWAGAVPATGEPDYELMSVARGEFVQNIADSDYVLCARGGGNFSYRLYETMSAGRIPVFIDTDCVLPFEEELDWRSLCVWVDAAEVDQVGDAVAEEHLRLGPDGFAERQRTCRRVWEDLLSPAGFFRNFWRALPTAELH
jgi:hypothetical protein